MPAHEYMAQFARRNLVGEGPPDPAGLDNRDVKTVYSIVYYTAPKTFDGPAVYVTDTSNLPSAANNQPATTNAQPTGKTNPNSVTDQTTLTTAIVKQSSPSPVATTSPSETSSINITQVASYLSLSTVPTGAAASAIISAANARNTGDPASESASKMTSGAKAGLACGIIALVSLFLLTAWFCRKHALKKKQQNQFNQMNEKSGDNSNEKGIIHNVAGAPAPTRGTSNRTAKTASTAPRLSIRPVTQFAPEFSGQNPSPGMHGAANPAQDPFRDPATAMPSAWERRGAANAANDPSNPFGNHAEIDNAVDRDAVALDTPTALQTPAAEFPPMPPQTQNASPPVPRNENVGAAGAIAGAAAAGLAPGALRAAAGNNKSDMSVNTNLSGSTVATHHPPRAGEPEVPQVPPSPGPAPVGAPPSTPDSDRIHRVQLDFMPSMADELEVKVGELVRLIHAYDDGWCMCVRFDRSASGVVPRSCMSEQPVKPMRKNGPPIVRPPQAPRNRAPSGSGQSRPWSPVQNHGRPQTPENFPFPNVAPLQGRSSPGPNGSPVNRPRANSHGVFAGQPGRAGSPMGRPRAPSHGAFGGPGGMSPQFRPRPRTPSNGPMPGPLTPQRGRASPGPMGRPRTPSNGPHGFSPNGGRNSPRGRPRGPSNASANRPMSPLNPAANRGRSSSAAAYSNQLRGGGGDGPYAAAGLPMSPVVMRPRSNSDQRGPVVREAPSNMPFNGQAF
ncbi:hypothetical protein IWZ00DRAFT_377454 [Phyllosticta capitalensis]